MVIPITSSLCVYLEGCLSLGDVMLVIKLTLKKQHTQLSLGDVMIIKLLG